MLIFGVIGMTGIELVASIRAQRGLADLQLIFMSDDPSELASRGARTAGATSYALKPYAPAELLADVRRLLPPESNSQV